MSECPLRKNFSCYGVSFSAFNPLDNFYVLILFSSIAFPMAEVISTYIPPSFYEVSTIMGALFYGIEANRA
jgi:hypothetical protein